MTLEHTSLNDLCRMAFLGIDSESVMKAAFSRLGVEDTASNTMLLEIAAVAAVQCGEGCLDEYFQATWHYRHNANTNLSKHIAMGLDLVHLASVAAANRKFELLCVINLKLEPIVFVEPYFQYQKILINSVCKTLNNDNIITDALIEKIKGSDEKSILEELMLSLASG